jgi:hypothetical protein
MFDIQYNPTNAALVVAVAASPWLIPETNGVFPVDDSFSETGDLPIAENVVDNSNFVVDSQAAQWVKFQSLAKEWREQRGSSSSITEVAMLTPYQEIIGMGLDAISPIIAELRSEGDDPDQWFWALRAITKANPVKPEDRGNFRKMAEAWLAWAEEEGYAG